MPNSTLTGTLFSAPVELGSYLVDGTGTADFTFATAMHEAAVHTLRVDGLGIDGQARRAESAIQNDCTARTAVAGAALDATAVSGRAFGSTGVAARELLSFGFDLIAVGLVLRAAAQRRRKGDTSEMAVQ